MQFVPLLLAAAACLAAYDAPCSPQLYAQLEFDGTYYLAFRDIPNLIDQYVRGSRAIDYGCGPGRSTRLLRRLGFDVIGVDISEDMLVQASSSDPSNHYLEIESGSIPVMDDSCDFVFSSLVLLMIATEHELAHVCADVYRCLRPGGIFMIVTNSESLFSYPWTSYHTDYPDNRSLYSGKKVKIGLKDFDIEFVNFYWTHTDYMDTFAGIGFEFVECLLPTAQFGEGDIDWESELTHPPYAIYVIRKPAPPSPTLEAALSNTEEPTAPSFPFLTGAD